MICNVESQHSAEITWRYYSENSLLRMSNAMHKYVSFLFLVVFVFISECVCGCIIITIHRVYSLLTSDSFCNTWEREKKDYNKSLPSHHQLRIKPSSHLWLYCSMTHTHTRTHTHTGSVCVQREMINELLVSPLLGWLCELVARPLWLFHQ